MCGRYVVFSEKDIEEINQIIREVSERFGKDSVKTGEIYPTNQAPVFVAEKGTLQTTLMTWGLPQYNRSGVIINARAETAHEKRTFKTALDLRRCVIPSTGFYEWTHNADKKAKEKFLFNLSDGPMLYMAGLYNLVPNELPRYVVLTTEANDSMKEIHNRMPVILKPNEIDEWINNPSATMEILHRTPPELVKEKVG
jgi:putative SOS response-associated peptidase YedK